MRFITTAPRDGAGVAGRGTAAMAKNQRMTPNLYTNRALVEKAYPDIDRIKKAWLVPNRIIK